MNNIEKIKLLPVEFENKNGKFRQVFKNDEWYIYSRVFSETTYFEVFKIKVVDCFDFETKTPTGERKETYPNNAENFGLWAWCCLSLEDALKYTTVK